MSLSLLRPARRRLLLLAVLVLALSLVLAGRGGAAWAAFSRTTANSGNSWGADTLDPPTSPGYSRPCTATLAVPTYVGGATATAASGTATLTKPAGTTTNDLLVVFSIITDDTTDNNASTPSGWTRQIDQYYTGHGSNIRVFTKVAGGSEPASYAISGYDTSDHGVAVLAVYRGVSTTAPVNVSNSQTNTTSTSATAPSVTTTSADTKLLTALVGIATTTMGTPSGTTSRNSIVATTDVLAVFDQSLSSAGATGTRTGTMTASKYSIGVTLALTPAPGAPDPTVTFMWTPTTDTYASGYKAVRTGGGTVTLTVPGRTTSSANDTSTTATQAYVYSLTAYYGNWTSTAATVTVPAC